MPLYNLPPTASSISNFLIIDIEIIRAYNYDLEITSTDIPFAAFHCADSIVQMRQPFYDKVLHGNAPQFGSAQAVLTDIADSPFVVPLHLRQWTLRGVRCAVLHHSLWSSVFT